MKNVVSFYKDVVTYFNNKFEPELKKNQIELIYYDRKDFTSDDQAIGLISGTVSNEELDLLPSLEWIIVPYTGLNGLDLEELGRRGIQVYNTSAHAHFVAERALALTLALMGKIVLFHNGLVNQNWGNRMSKDRIYWHSLYGKKVAIVGYGSIGRAYKALVEPFGCPVGVLAYKERSYEGVEILESIEDLAQWCDVMMIAAPITDDTKDLIDASVLKYLEGKCLVNVGRGGVVNEKATYESLVKNELVGFASDVWYTYPNKEMGERYPSDYPYHELDNVVMTPHNAGFEATSRDLRYKDVMEQIIGLLEVD